MTFNDYYNGTVDRVTGTGFLEGETEPLFIDLSNPGA